MATKFSYINSWFAGAGKKLVCHNGLVVSVLAKAQPAGTPLGTLVPSSLLFGVPGWTNSIVLGKDAAFSFSYKLQALYDGRIRLSNSWSFGGGYQVGEQTYSDADAAVDKYARFDNQNLVDIGHLQEVIGARLAMHVWVNSVKKDEFIHLISNNSGFDVNTGEDADFSVADASKLISMFLAFANPIGPVPPASSSGFLFPWLNPDSGSGFYKLTESDFFKQFSLQVTDSTAAVQPQTFVGKVPEDWVGSSQSPVGWNNWPVTTYGQDGYELPFNTSPPQFWQGFYRTSTPQSHASPIVEYHTGWLFDCNPAQYLAVLLRNLARLPDGVWQTWSVMVQQKSANLVDAPLDFLTRCIGSMRASSLNFWTNTPSFTYPSFGNSFTDAAQAIDVQDFTWAPNGWSGEWAQYLRGLAHSCGLLAACFPAVRVYRAGATSPDGWHSLALMDALGTTSLKQTIALPCSAVAPPTEFNQQLIINAYQAKDAHSSVSVQWVSSEFSRFEKLGKAASLPTMAPWGAQVDHCVVVSGRTQRVFSDIDTMGNGRGGSWTFGADASASGVLLTLSRWLGWTEFAASQLISYALQRAVLETYLAAPSFLQISPLTFTPSLPGIFKVPVFSPSALVIYSLPSKVYSTRFGVLTLTLGQSVLSTPVVAGSESISAALSPTSVNHSREFTALMMSFRIWAAYTCAILSQFGLPEQELLAHYPVSNAPPGTSGDLLAWLSTQPNGGATANVVIALNRCAIQFFLVSPDTSILDPTTEMPKDDLLPVNGLMNWFSYEQGAPAYYNLQPLPLPLGGKTQVVVPTLASPANMLILLLAIAVRVKHYWTIEVAGAISPGTVFEDATLGPP